MPVSADAKIRVRQKKEIRASLRKEYKGCVESHKYRVDADICEDIRKNAIKYGYWYSPEELAAEKEKREIRAHIYEDMARSKF